MITFVMLGNTNKRN